MSDAFSFWPVKKKLLYLYFLLLLKKKKNAKKQRQKRRWYVRPLNVVRSTDSEFTRLIVRMQKMDQETHFEYFRMSKENFAVLLGKVKPFISHNIAHRHPILAEERLAVTLRIISSGMPQVSASQSYFMAKSTVQKILLETCRGIYLALHEEVLAPPTTEDWEQKASDFWTKWNYPNCLGAIDGKHVVIKAPANSGSLFRNYKETFSVVLLAVVDASYLFRIVSSGTNGKQSDGGIFVDSAFGTMLESGKLEIPPDSPFPGTDILCPHVFVGDEAFPLKENVMRPFPGKDLSTNHRGRIHNYRLSRARRVVENAFGILATRWRIFRGPIECSSNTVDNIVMACVCLHNFSRRISCSTANSASMPAGFVDGDDRAGDYRDIVAGDTYLLSFKGVGNRSANNAVKIRENFADYFLSR